MQVRYLQNGIQKMVNSIKGWLYLKQKESIVARLTRETEKEEARAKELQQILEVKQKLVIARAKTRQLVKDIGAVGYATKKEV